MQTEISKQFSDLLSRVTGHLSVPLFRNGYALISSSFLTSAIGMVYWIVAARIYPTNIIGLNSALISSMMLLAGISQLNLSNALIRFVPSAGTSTLRFVALTYLAGPAVAVIVTLIFITQSPDWFPTIGVLVSNPWIAASLILSTMGYCIFILEDGVLTGLRRATWVPVENALFGLIKVVLMLILAISIPMLGIFFSWLVSLAVVIFPTTYFIFRWLIPQHQKSSIVNDGLPRVRQIARYVAGDYLAGLSWIACTTLIPLLVTQIAGATANAYYFLSWQIALLLYAVCGNMGSSLVVEASTSSGQANHLSRQVLIQLSYLVIPAAAVLCLGAPIILQLFGNNYAREASQLLRLLALSSIPYIVITIFVSMARIHRRISRAVLVYASLSILVVGLSVFFLHKFGVVGVGYAWLGGQSIMASIILFYWLNRSFADKRKTTRLLHKNDGNPGSLDRQPEALQKSGSISLTKNPWRYIQDRNRILWLNQRIPELAESLKQRGLTGGESWVCKKWIPNQADRPVCLIGPVGGPPSALVKVYLSGAAFESAHNEQIALDLISTHPGLTDLRLIVPHQIARGEISGHPYIVEHVLPGIDSRFTLSNPVQGAHMQRSAYEKILQLHQGTAQRSRVTSSKLEAWVDQPADILRKAARQWPVNTRWMIAINNITERLRVSLIGKNVCTSWVHGDFTPGNLLWSQQSQVITGIVDWELAKPDCLPVLDIFQLILASRREMTHNEFGHIIGQLLNHQDWTAGEESLIQAHRLALGEGTISDQDAVLLFWLQHIASNLKKSATYAHHWIWIGRNILPVLNLFQKNSVLAF